MTRSPGVDRRRRRALEPWELEPQTAGHGPVRHATVARALAGPDNLTPSDVLCLQRTAGNSAVTRMIARNGDDGPKLKIKTGEREKSAASSKGPAIASTHPDAGAVRNFLTILDDNLQAVMQLSDPTTKLGKAASAAETSYMPECSGEIKAKLQAVRDAVGTVVDDVLESTDDLVAQSGPERQQVAQIKAVRARRARAANKLASQRRKLGKAWTGLGKSYHQGRIGHYQAKMTGLSATEDQLDKAIKAAATGGSRKELAMALVKPMKDELMGVFAVVGQPKTLGFGEGKGDPAETMVVIIQNYASYVEG